jgi:hypothetical protein
VKKRNCSQVRKRPWSRVRWGGKVEWPDQKFPSIHIADSGKLASGFTFSLVHRALTSSGTGPRSTNLLGLRVIGLPLSVACMAFGSARGARAVRNHNLFFDSAARHAIWDFRGNTGMAWLEAWTRVSGIPLAGRSICVAERMQATARHVREQ